MTCSDLILVFVLFILDLLHFLICLSFRGWQIPQANAFGLGFRSIFDLVLIDIILTPTRRIPGAFLSPSESSVDPVGLRLRLLSEFSGAYPSFRSLLCLWRSSSEVLDKSVFEVRVSGGSLLRRISRPTSDHPDQCGFPGISRFFMHQK